MKLYWLIDNIDYISTNCFQHQMRKTLEKEFDVTFINLDQVKKSKCYSNNAKFFCSMKARTVFQNIDSLATFLNGSEVILYDQDPWEWFVDNGPYKGSYQLASEKLNVKSFFVTSKWWADFIRKELGVHTTFVQMGVLPEYCQWRPWEDRRVDLGFKGKLHPHRKKFFEELDYSFGMSSDPLETKKKVEIDTTPSNYRDFLDALSYYKIYVHSEERVFVIDGKPIPYNGIWVKEIEAASQGCFVLRDYEEESEAYGVSDIPTIMTFESVADAKWKICEIMEMSTSKKNELTKTAVEKIRQQDSWKNSLAKAVKET